MKQKQEESKAQIGGNNSGFNSGGMGFNKQPSDSGFNKQQSGVSEQDKPADVTIPKTPGGGGGKPAFKASTNPFAKRPGSGTGGGTSSSFTAQPAQEYKPEPAKID